MIYIYNEIEKQELTDYLKSVYTNNSEEDDVYILLTLVFYLRHHIIKGTDFHKIANDVFEDKERLLNASIRAQMIINDNFKE